MLCTRDFSRSNVGWSVCTTNGIPHKYTRNRDLATTVFLLSGRLRRIYKFTAMLFDPPVE